MAPLENTDSQRSNMSISSHSIYIQPVDSRRRFWAKIIRANDPLPIPGDVLGANDIPGPYLSTGDEELLPGDCLLVGECNHHWRTDRGWSYRLTAVTQNGNLLSLRSGFSRQKAEMKAQGMSPELLKGAGDIAGMVRVAHGLRSGLEISE